MICCNNRHICLHGPRCCLPKSDYYSVNMFVQYVVDMVSVF
uniref:Uncharacterized protein n=1 Tax=Rhizophora mucronata TaxID=61149 RepID=A0A2P2P6H4_RHIMU